MNGNTFVWLAMMINLGAMFFYMSANDWPRAIYWFAAFLLGGATLYMK